MNNARKLAVKVVSEVLTNDSYSNIVLNRELNSTELNSKDRGLATEIVYGTLKYKHTIDTILNHYIKTGIKKLDKDIANILRISIYQMKYLDKIPPFAVVNEAVEMSKRKSPKWAKLVNGVLRNYLRNNDDVNYYNKNSEVESLSFEYSFPEWMVKLFLKQYKKENTEKILKGLNNVPAVNIRVNSLKTNYEEAWEKLQNNGYDIEEGKVCPESITIKKGSSIENNPLFKEGLITVQDESAMMVAAAMDLENNMTVMDLCSAPGGKTCHISEIMNNTGKVMAFDIHENKLPLIKSNADRLGISNISCNVLDASLYNESFKSLADRVLIDVPCSGIGIIRKKPEIKWNKDMKSMRDLVKIQRNIMVNAAKYLKEGGKLIYSTCTLNKEENEDNIKWFLKNNSNFKIEKLYYGNVDNIIYSEEGYVTILPDDNMDGFFIAKMIKRG